MLKKYFNNKNLIQFNSFLFKKNPLNRDISNKIQNFDFIYNFFQNFVKKVKNAVRAKKFVMKQHPFFIPKPSFIPFFVGPFTFVILFNFINFIHKNESNIIYFSSNAFFFICIIEWLNNIHEESERVSIYNWSYQKNIQFGVVLFIISEIMIFFGLFWSYLHFSLNPSISFGEVWPPAGVEAVSAFGVPFINTLLLLLSGIAANVTYYSLRGLNIKKIRIFDRNYINKIIFDFNKKNLGNDDIFYWVDFNFNKAISFFPFYCIKIKNFTLYKKIAKIEKVSFLTWRFRLSFSGIIYAIIFGTIFVFFQFCEYANSSFGIADGAYGSIFYFLTGLHGFHVIIGIIFLLIAYKRFSSKAYKYTFSFSVGFILSVWYWHFVDIVWFFVFFIIYIWGGDYSIKNLLISIKKKLCLNSTIHFIQFEIFHQPFRIIELLSQL